MRRHRVALAAILAVGIFFRFWGIDWGLPRTDLNPDELNVLQITEGISWDDLDPEFYNYSGLTFHLNFISAEVVKLLGVEPDSETRLFLHRLWAATWGSLTLMLVYPIAFALTDRRRAALMASAVFAVLPLHIWDSHFAVSDISLAFWATLATYLAIRAWQDPSLKRFLIGGAVVGVAIGVKFNGALAGATFIAAAVLVWIEGRLPWTTALRNLCAAGAVSLLAFAVVSPYSVLNIAETVAAYRLEWYLVDERGHYGFDLTADGWQYHRGIYQLFALFPFAFGIAMWPAVFMGFWLFLAQEGRAQRALGLAYFVLQGYVLVSWFFVPLRYYLVLLPLMAVFGGVFFDTLFRNRRVPRPVALGVATLIFGYTLAFTVSTTQRFTDDTRLQAGRWGDANIGPDSVVYNIRPIFGFAYMPRYERDDIELRAHPLELVRGLWGRSRRDRDHVWLAVSSVTYQRNYRQGAIDPQPIADWDYVRANHERYELEARFESRYLNKDLYTWLDPMFDGYFISPTVELYRAVPRGSGRRRRGPPEQGAESGGDPDEMVQPPASSASSEPLR